MGIRLAYLAVTSLLTAIYHPQRRRPRCARWQSFDARHPGQQRPCSLFTLVIHLFTGVWMPIWPGRTRVEYLTVFTTVTTYALRPTVLKSRNGYAHFSLVSPNLSPIRDATPGNGQGRELSLSVFASSRHDADPIWKMRASRLELGLPHPMPG
ncbi:hypothetical protein BD311DRAFT_696225 [Dichomitus squalens]|uniref:Uncharacterized protein n=1 Tax=Dichomitus squalens TaxID=114155 RepID=A0A4V2K070_9APHY|nr:hypothetical protein BD311DRAFT_696225 [Dichomitus squalens]